MEDDSASAIISRLKEASSSTTDLELSKKMGLSKQSIADARFKKKVPALWIPKAAKEFNVTTDWLFFGREPMRASHAPEESSNCFYRDPPSSLPPQPACPNCDRLEADLAAERMDRREVMAELRQLNAERREAVAELRQLHKDKEILLRENAELKALLAKLQAADTAVAQPVLEASLPAGKELLENES